LRREGLALDHDVELRLAFPRVPLQRQTHPRARLTPEHGHNHVERPVDDRALVDAQQDVALQHSGLGRRRARSHARELKVVVALLQRQPEPALALLEEGKTHGNRKGKFHQNPTLS
jgi:hypothetical protein